jgi:hypothetical protein
VTARGAPQKHPGLPELQQDVVSVHPAIHLSKAIDDPTSESIRRRLVRRCPDPFTRQRRMGKVGDHGLLLLPLRHLSLPDAARRSNGSVEFKRRAELGLFQAEWPFQAKY